MSVKSYFYLLIACGFSCQGIIASLSTNNTKSADFLVRHKRVINHEPGGHAIAHITEMNYIVSIRHQGRSNCAGAILSRYTVITAADCVAYHLWQYQVHSGAGYIHRSNNHNITEKSLHSGNPPHGPYDSIALVKVDPPFVPGPNTGIIRLHVEPVLSGTIARVSGWGYRHPTSQPMPVQQRLRSITLPIMNHRECIAAYAGHFQITNKHICTYDAQKLCAIHDIGTPLVIDNFLVGIHNYKGTFTNIRNPDVYIDVQLQEYSGWIQRNIIP